MAQDSQDPSSSSTETDVLLCGFNLSNLSRDARFTFCVVGIFATYVCYGALQEAIFSGTKMQSHSAFLTLYQFAIYSILSFSELRSQRQLLTSVQSANVSIHVYILLALLSLGTMTFSNMSVSFLNYPTQVIFKCCKMIPVMIGGVLVLGKRYTRIQVSAVLCMTVGLIFFTLVDVAIQPNFNIIGVILVSMALCCDGALGNLQEMVMRKMKATNVEIMVYSYSIGFLFLLSGLAFTNQLVPSIYHFIEHPMKTFGYGFVFSVCGYFGVHFVLCLVQSHGALTAVTVTTLRKAVSIVLSFILFEKPFDWGYVWSGLLVVCGIYLNMYQKYQNKWNGSIRNRIQRLFQRKSMRTPILPL